MVYFLIGLFVFIFKSFKSSLHILGNIYQINLLQIFSPQASSLSFHSIDSVFCREVFNFNEIGLLILSFKDHAFGIVSKKSSPNSRLSKFSLMLSSRNFISLYFTFGYVIHFSWVLGF